MTAAERRRALQLGQRLAVGDDRLHSYRERRPPARRHHARLLVHLDGRPRIDIIADDLHQERYARGIARVVAWVLDVLAREPAA